MSNIDKIKPEILLQLDRPRKFLFNLKGLRIAEEKTGKSLFKQVRWADLGFSDVSLLLWAGLLSDDPTLTRDQVDEMFDLMHAVENFKQIVQVIESAIDRAMPSLNESEIAAIQEQKKKLRIVTGMKAAEIPAEAN